MRKAFLLHAAHELAKGYAFYLLDIAFLLFRFVRAFVMITYC